MPDLKFYDTLSRRPQDFEPLDPERVLVYVCGPTVYDEPHLGHARAAVVFDVLVRLLRRVYGAEHVTYLRNYTDVDDKIIARANERGVAIEAITERYIAAYAQAMAALGCAEPDVTPRVTEVMPEIVAFIERLLDAGTAYAVDGDVYYDVRAFADYGKLSHRNVDELQTVHRVEVDPRKRNPLDFALWKAAKPDEPAWDSPWGPGRPGWHIECSVMATHFGRDTLDIHGGGQDLIFPHHENEIAQCEAVTGVPFARTWLHNGFVQINAEKMSKSLHNFTTVGEILKIWPAEAVRYFLISAHYRTPLDFTVPALGEAAKALTRIYDAFDAVVATPRDDLPAPSPKQGKALAALAAELQATEAGMLAALADDLNTPQALARLFEGLRELNRVMRGFPQGLPVAGAPVATAAAALRGSVQHVLGLATGSASDYVAATNAAGLAILNVPADEIAAAVADRETARADHDFARADALRDELLARGIQVTDGRAGTAWRVDLDAVVEALQ